LGAGMPAAAATEGGLMDLSQQLGFDVNAASSAASYGGIDWDALLGGVGGGGGGGGVEAQQQQAPPVAATGYYGF